MKRTEMGQPEQRAEPAAPPDEGKGANPPLVNVLTDFLQDAGKYVLEDDWESYYT
jgi:hypothetical protein